MQVGGWKERVKEHKDASADVKTLRTTRRRLSETDASEAVK